MPDLIAAHPAVAHCDCGGTASQHFRSLGCGCGCRLDPPCETCGALTSKHEAAS